VEAFQGRDQIASCLFGSDLLQCTENLGQVERSSLAAVFDVRVVREENLNNGWLLFDRGWRAHLADLRQYEVYLGLERPSALVPADRSLLMLSVCRVDGSLIRRNTPLMPGP
jgi:hypothetical protein